MAIMAGLVPHWRRVAVPHMHFAHMINGKAYDLWHIWDIAGMIRQLGEIPEGQRRSV